ncbi:MAG: thiamine-phosphate kinase, partial [Prevotellaceae bacterium]|nr:thiamine-phosphate kinase [Prevotellaceae bacterium]
MNISELGEQGLIDRLAQKTAAPDGDDAAVVAPTPGASCLLAGTLLLEGVHFDLTYVPLKYLGYKAATAAFTDVYAMNGEPKQLTLALGLSRRFGVEQVDELHGGVQLACERYGVQLAGLSASASLTGLTLGLSVRGEAPAAEVARRSGAQPTDLVCITGDLGAAYMGLLLLEREKQVVAANPHATPQLAEHEYIVGRYLKPEAPREAILALRSAGVAPTAMTAVARGLAAAMLHVCRRSGVGAHLYLDKIPIAKPTFDMADELHFDAATAALNGGEDYELLFTIPLALHDRVKDFGGHVVGHVVEQARGALLIPPS